MVTAPSSGTPGTALAEAERIAFLLRTEGFCVTRLKIEAAPWTAGVPRTDAEASELAAIKIWLRDIVQEPSETP